MTNTTLLIALPLVLAAIFLMYGLFRNLVRLWLDHRVKMALLEKLEHRPDLVNSVQDLQSLLESPFAQ
ncbi:MAG: hypothetical protein HYZ00_06805, partial [Candidatus Hydrogenedentes bacterium]|nr:hypothetical protein [Candidatus Hydrogenedentota bacterium]